MVMKNWSSRSNGVDNGLNMSQSVPNIKINHQKQILDLYKWHKNHLEKIPGFALRAGGHGLFDFCGFVVYWYFVYSFSCCQGCFQDSRRSSMRICFQTLAHDRSGLSLHSSDMVYILNWRSWRLQARCTIPFLSFLVVFKVCVATVNT